MNHLLHPHTVSSLSLSLTSSLSLSTMQQPHSSTAIPSSSSTSNAETSLSIQNAQVSENRPRQSRRVRITYGGRFNRTISITDDSAIVRDDKWSCLAVIFSLWFFVAVTMIMGVYGSMSVALGPCSSIVFHPNPVFVQYVKVENLQANPGLILYGTYQYPSLDVVSTWRETFNISIPYGSEKEWKLYLNRGSEVNISYSLSSESSSVYLVIAEGAESLSEWMADPTYPNTTLSWNMIHGTGMITQEIFRSSSYYVALGNLEGEEVESQVELNLTVKAILHNTTNAYYKCALTSSPCGLNIFFPYGNTAVLVSPAPQQNTSNEEWYVKLSYGPRWLTYIFGIGGLTMIMFWAFNVLTKLQSAHDDRVESRSEGPGPDQASLLSRKYDDRSSWGSSYDSLPEDEEDLDFLAGGSTDGKCLGDGETSNNTRRLCAICFDAPRDCFFLPCGHCVACYECGTRIVEAAGTCPVCRRNMKKVRKIFTV
ncbi:E3 ubiquitin-protein ligase APD2-like [Trifolium pratense]|uniref:E3 ubiquitin-protein ligase APD2-like n=1 Tax=Trifolium pratense TaxID=57577 RepID=UPI001E68FE68|nr:E3 ubiquitin-protein ligase APD2-like [Trifolium pratense]